MERGKDKRDVRMEEYSMINSRQQLLTALMSYNDYRIPAHLHLHPSQD